MKKHKNFFLVLILIYIVLSLLGILLFHSPDFSSSHVSKYKELHHLFREVSKKSEYYKFKERPNLFNGDKETLENYKRVLEYENTSEFKAEKRRIHLYLLWFRTLNTLTLIVASFRLGWKPLQNSLGKYQKKILTRKNTIEENYKKVQEELRKAEEKQIELQRLVTKIEERKNQIISERLKQIEAQNKEALEQIEFLLETSKKEAEIECLHNLRATIIKESLEKLEKKLLQTETPERLMNTIDKFNFLIEMLS